MLNKICELFKRKEPEMTPAIKKFADRVDKQCKRTPRGVWCPPKTEAQEVVRCLKELFLGEDWYIVDSVSGQQANSIILDEILKLHCKAYRERSKRND